MIVLAHVAGLASLLGSLSAQAVDADWKFHSYFNPNDLRGRHRPGASNGDLYFTGQWLTGLHDPTGMVFRVHAAGRVDCLLDDIPSPNGIARSRSGVGRHTTHIAYGGPDRRTLYITELESGTLRRARMPT